MRGAVLYAPGDVRLEERDDPKIIEPTDAVLRRIGLSRSCWVSAWAGWAFPFHLTIAHILQVCSRHTADVDAGLPARALDGEAYRGRVLWDEIFALPCSDLRLPEVTRGRRLTTRALGSATSTERTRRNGTSAWATSSTSRLSFRRSSRRTPVRVTLGGEQPRVAVHPERVSHLIDVRVAGDVRELRPGQTTTFELGLGAPVRPQGPGQEVGGAG